jgi:hypothetical protein
MTLDAGVDTPVCCENERFKMLEEDFAFFQIGIPAAREFDFFRERMDIQSSDHG